ncbi:MAG: histone deacetylase family protein, partial [Planctomycetaceae bacterium]|nr:histone deacetylase family protein [Planctomycetaceae bacterium]
MFRVRRIFDDLLQVNQSALQDVRRIYCEQFPEAPVADIDSLPAKLRNPFQMRFRTVLYVAESRPGSVSGFAIVLHEPILKFCYLDYMAAGPKLTGRGIGAVLYEHVRDETLLLGSRGLFFECLPDDESGCADAAVRRQNAGRLKFYERYGARPIIGTEYELPVPGGSSDNLPHLMFDDLDTGRPPSKKFVRDVIRAILERKYGDLCPPEYVDRVVGSVRSDPVKLRAPQYVRPETVHRPPASGSTAERIAMAVTDRHEIHHIRERGYVESPVRIRAIETELMQAGLVDRLTVREYPMKHILAVHDRALVHYQETACATSPEGKSVYPYVFPVRNATRPPREMSVLAGYYCIDTFTPINRHAYPAARRAVDCSLAAADAVRSGRHCAYALVRPPGHHAEHKTFGGFCYFCNAAIAAQYLCGGGRVAILDIDYHHGNGQQDIFYDRADVLTVSIHGDPDFAYPYFTGFADERGTGSGEGFNLNLPLPEHQTGDQYRTALRQALDAVAQFAPTFLIIALGLDTGKGDPTGTWSLGPGDFEKNGRLIGELRLPTVVI